MILCVHNITLLSQCYHIVYHIVINQFSKAVWFRSYDTMNPT